MSEQLEVNSVAVRITRLSPGAFLELTYIQNGVWTATIRGIKIDCVDEHSRVTVATMTGPTAYSAIWSLWYHITAPGRSLRVGVGRHDETYKAWDSVKARWDIVV